MRKDPEANEIYRHFKGNCYQVLCIAADSEKGGEMVVYQALYAPYGIYVRPLEMFMSETDHDKYPDADAKYRFTRIGAAGKLNEDGAADAEINVHAQHNADMPNAAEKHTCPDKQQTAEKVSDEDQLDPQVAAFLDAHTCEEKLAILDSAHERITDEMINTMAVASDLEINDGDIETRFEDLRYCLMTLGKFECDRLR